MLIKAANAIGNVFTKAHLKGDVRATLAAGFNQLARNLATVLKNIDDGPKTLGQPRLETSMRKHKPQGLRQTAIDQLKVLFEGHVVDQIEFTNPRRIAAAS